MLLFSTTRATQRSLGLPSAFCSRCVRLVYLTKGSILTISQVSIQDINQYAFVVEGVEKITNIMTQYRIVERLYLVKRYEATAQLENHITDLYALALKFLVKAKKYYQKNTASQFKGYIGG